MFGWLKKPSRDYGKITLLPGDRAILGPPLGYLLTQDRAAEIHYLVAQWLDKGGLLTLPFPVDVDDRR